jgi:hypothetical protein
MPVSQKNPERSDSRRALRAGHPDTWIAVDPGDTIRGAVADVTLAWSDVQDQGRGDGWYPLLTVVADEATGYEAPCTLRVHGMGAVLQSELIRQEPAPGELVEIVYHGTGEVKTRGRNAPEIYRVKMPDRDPKETAERVYGSLRHKIRRPGSAEPVEPTADEGAGFLADENAG